jgi:hypothetical protein
LEKWFPSEISKLTPANYFQKYAFLGRKKYFNLYHIRTSAKEMTKKRETSAKILGFI